MLSTNGMLGPNRCSFDGDKKQISSLIQAPYYKFFAAVFLFMTSLYAQEGSHSFHFTTTNNIYLNGETSKPYGDNLNTGTIEMEYRTDLYTYALVLTAYTQKYEELDSSVAESSRVDTMEVGVSRNFKSYYGDHYTINTHIGAQLLFSGNFGGKEIQNFIHKNTGNSHVDISYSNETHNAFGVHWNMDYLHDINPFIKLYGDTEAKVYSDTSMIASVEVGTRFIFKYAELKVGIGAKHIKPFKHELVKALTVNHNPKYLLGEIKIPLMEKFSVDIGTILEGDHPYGNKKNDPFSYLNISYIF